MQNLDPAVDDLSAVQADDRLLDLLGSGLPSAVNEPDDLSMLMVAWRNEIESLDAGDLVDLDTAATVISYATRPTSQPRRLIRAAVLALLVLAGLLAAFAAIKAGAA